MQVFEVSITNILLVNFLVTILQKTYTQMVEQGNFSYYCNQYQFIERYSIALLNEWNYAELVVHPAPFNFFTLFLVPAVL